MIAFKPDGTPFQCEMSDPPETWCPVLEWESRQKAEEIRQHAEAYAQSLKTRPLTTEERRAKDEEWATAFMRKVGQ
jgi:hypothetical protein